MFLFPTPSISGGAQRRPLHAVVSRPSHVKAHTHPTVPVHCESVARASRTMQEPDGSDMYITGTMDLRWNNSIHKPAFR
jgi:hypothetical protein